MIRRSGVSLLALVAVLAAMSIASQAQSQAVMTRHTRDVTLNGQAPMVGHLPANQSMRLVLVLPLRDQEGLDNFLRDVYDPSSPNYRQFLTVEQFTERFGPTQSDYETVKQFARDNGLRVVSTSPNRVNLQVAGSVANIEKALHVTMGIYQHPTENRTYYSPDREPTTDMSVQLWSIAGLENYSLPHPLYVRKDATEEIVHSNATTGSCPSKSFCGSDMRAAYYGGTALNGSGQSLGLFEYVGTDLADLTTYYTNTGQTDNVPVTLLSTDGTSTSCKAPGCDDTEQTLDMTQALGMAPNMSSLVMYVGSTDAAIFGSMSTAKPLNAQLSSSWAWNPADPTTDDPYFQTFAAQGQNLFQATGDSGKWPQTYVWPADDVYLTAVGGTDLSTSSAGGPWSSETAWADGGGGISPHNYAIPSWQVAAAAGCSKCSQVYRNAPDVSANANYTFYVCADQKACTANLYGGTSFAAPMWAGFLALVNQQALLNGQSVLGFINPTLYSIGGGSSYTSEFHDITSGSNGYSATVGYDLATGWGSPNGTALITGLLGTTSSGFTLSANPTSVSVAQGSAGTSTITSTVTGGFNSAVTLSASGQPSGVTVGFNPTSITGNGTSTMTMTVGSTVATGTYTITVKGTSGSTTSTTTVTLTVTGTGNPSFTISVSPTKITVAKGATGTATITTTVSGGFNSAITLSATGQGGKQTVTFSPNPIAAPGAGTSTMTIKVGSSSTTGNKKMTITGTGGGQTHTTTFTLDVIQ